MDSKDVTVLKKISEEAKMITSIIERFKYNAFKDELVNGVEVIWRD